MQESSEFACTLPVSSQVTMPHLPADLAVSLRPPCYIWSCVQLILGKIKCTNPQLAVETCCGHHGFTQAVHQLCQITCESAHKGSTLDGGKKWCPHHYPFFGNANGSQLIGGIIGEGRPATPLLVNKYTQQMEPLQVKSHNYSALLGNFVPSPMMFMVLPTLICHASTSMLTTLVSCIYIFRLITINTSVLWVQLVSGSSRVIMRMSGCAHHAMWILTKCIEKGSRVKCKCCQLHNCKGTVASDVMSLPTQCNIATIVMGQAEAQQRVLNHDLWVFLNKSTKWIRNSVGFAMWVWWSWGARSHKLFTQICTNYTMK